MSEATFTIRSLREEDFPQIQRIYEKGLDSGHASFERKAPSWEKFSSSKIMETVFVAVDPDDNSRVLGWVSAAPASSRQVYSGVVEDSVYVDPDAGVKGIGGALLDRLLEKCAELDKWSVHAWIFPENVGSAKLHKSRGFEKVATYHHVAKMPYGDRKGEWRDTDVWEKLLPKPHIHVDDLPDH